MRYIFVGTKNRSIYYAGQPGEFVGKVVRNDPMKDFEGYRDKLATKKKLLTDVLRKGDTYFRSIFIPSSFDCEKKFVF